MMYKLLIVDDEPDIVNYLYILFSEWDKYELEVYKAFAADKALELLNKVKIDIVVSDIKMPGINGLQLLDRIKHNWPECKVIFLTGHKEFEYIYEATRYNDVVYLLKTSTDKEIMTEVENAIRYIESRLLDETVTSRAVQQLEYALPFLQTEFITKLVYESEYYNTFDQKRLDELRISLNINMPVFMVIGRFDKRPIEMLYTEKTDYIHRVKLVAEKFLPDWFTSFHAVIEGTYLFWLMQPNFNIAINTECIHDKNEMEKCSLIIKGAFEAIQDCCTKTLNTTISFAIQTLPVELDELSKKYIQLTQTINSRIGAGTQMLLTEKNLPKINDDIPIEFNEELQKVYIKIRSLQILMTYLELSQHDDFLKVLEPFVHGLKTVTSMKSNIAMEIYYTISLILLSYINRFKLSTQIAFKIGLYKLSNVNEYSSWGEAADYLKQLAEVIFELQTEEQSKRAENSITKIKQHIAINLQEDLSLVRLADIVELNPSYLSRLFKQETGINLSIYVNQERIKRAKELIEENKLKINEISSKLGFDTPTYFTRFFKKAIGISPQEYRECTKNVKKR